MTKKEISEFNEGTATWHGKRLMDMTRHELYSTINSMAATIGFLNTKLDK